MKKIDHAGLRTWIEIDTKAIKANYKIFRTLVPKNIDSAESHRARPLGAMICGVVKSNAYGHNFTEFARELEKEKIDMLAVDSIVEALALRTAKIKTPILVLGYTLPEMFTKAVGKNIHLTISSKDALQTFLKSSSAKKISIHLKVDTGMHRQGFLLKDQADVLKMLHSVKGVKVEGLYTHFASAKDPANTVFTDMQIAEFARWRESLQNAGFKLLVHASATGGAFVFPKAHFDMVRIGIGLYGVAPSDEISRRLTLEKKLKPVLSWKTIISETKEIPVGSGIGYDLTYRVQRPTRMAVCPVGYWHGYPRALSNTAEVLVLGKRAPVLGRVSMDMIVIDVTDIPKAKSGDEVVLIGTSGKEQMTAVELARRAGTSAYEILTRLNPLMKRIYR
jgi:alanine racemase